jgi:ABC-type nickel/cobalt efflux system permease component RcnA
MSVSLRPTHTELQAKFWHVWRHHKPTETYHHHHHHHHHHHRHKHPGLSHLARSASRVTVVLFIVFSVFQLFSFLVGCSGMILKVFGFVAIFAGVKVSSFCIQIFVYYVVCL